ncbi:unnamed protein product (macronuclear) [Paramecium tetraurelia]|uniref:Uncharacterized protein n=1 Tax=Paramecium tetraurelia TaxID=5888 RepID=A0BF91_PARTE|nr:uncharacterized protein GSPATT00028243001 [Paramecium tetraurelia]CAK57208.1 unnamed protein product [Paramecium tetraurelia]|eukprot:XP_001424606.1 hypothetical protein (macronuclear) [Paramecium tetraurelia strain d4-2]
MYEIHVEHKLDIIYLHSHYNNVVCLLTYQKNSAYKLEIIINIMDYIYIKQHLDNDPKMQRFIRNRILYQTSDTYHYANYKKRMNQSFDQSIHQTTLQKFNDLSYLVIDKLRQSPTRKSYFSRPTSATQRSPFIFSSNCNFYKQALQTQESQAVRNFKRKLNSSKRCAQKQKKQPIEYTCRQYKFIL